MLLLEPDRTQFDLKWRMFGIEVRVHPMFWVLSAMLGWSAIDQGIEFLLMWIACVFVSILVHELGHVLAGRFFGSDGHIVLYSFGGLAIGSSNLPYRWQRNIVYFAGPLAGFLLFGMVVAVVFALLPTDRPQLVVPNVTDLVYVPGVYLFRAGYSRLFVEVVNDLIVINLFWGILNLMPIWPLDGGRISRETLEWLSPRNGAAAALLISGILAAALAVNSLAAYAGHRLIPYLPAGGLYTAIFFGLLAVSSFQLYQAESSRRQYRSDDSSPWDRDDSDWRRGRGSWER